MPRTQLIHLWTFRSLWIGLALTVAPPIEAALEHHSSGVTWLVAICLWLAWGLGLVALLVPNPLSLTAIRLLALGSFVVTAVAALDDAPNALGLSWGLATFCWSLLSSIGALYVDAGSYGDERRFALRVPGQLLMGPLVVVSSMVLVGACLGPLLLAAKSWVLGVPITAAGFFLALQGTRILHQLTQRWLIFVPTGVVVVDPLQLREPLRIPNQDLESLRIAGPDPTAHDLTFGSLGRAIEISLDVPYPIAMRSTEAIDSAAVLVTPTRLLDALEEAMARGLGGN